MNVSKMLTSDKEKYLNVDKYLKQSVVGQDEAILLFQKLLKEIKLVFLMKIAQ